MRKGDLTTKAIGLAIAGVFAGTRLAHALQDATTKPADDKAKPAASEDKSAKDKAQAPTDKHTCKGANSCKGKGGCKAGDNGCAGKNSCKGKGGCAVKDGKPVHTPAKK